MAKAELKLLPAEGGQVTLEMHIDDKPMAHMILDEAHLDELISRVAKVRAGMADEVARELEPGQRLEAVPDPIWRAMPGPHGPILALRHPGLGWTSWALPTHEAKAIGKYLQDHAEPQKG